MMDRDLEAEVGFLPDIGSATSIVMTNPVEEPTKTVEEVLCETYVLNKPRRLCACKFRKMYLAAVCCLLMAVAMGFATGYSAPATYHMKKTALNPTADEITWIGSILAVGAMLGGLIGGPFADRLGRRACLLLNVFGFTAGWFSITVASTVIPIIFGRFVCGIACGVVSVAVPMYCVEIATPEVRGLLGSLFQTFMVTGNLLCTVIGFYVSWEELALSGAAMAGLALAFFAAMPESPKWWLTRGDRYRAFKAIRQLQGDQWDADRECDRIYTDLQSQPRGRLTLKECLNPKVFKPALLTVGLMLFQQCSGSNAVLFYSTEIFSTNKDFIDPRVATIILGAIQVVATFVSNLLVDRVGRKVLLFLSGAIMGISQLGLGFFYYESATSGHLDAKMPWIPLLSICVFIIAFSIGFGPIPWLLAAEMVPLRARSTVGGLATFANGLFAFLITKTFSQLLSYAHDYGAFMTYGVISSVSCFFVIVFIPETKGKEIEEITQIFCKNRTESTDTLEAIRTLSFNSRPSLPIIDELPKNEHHELSKGIRYKLSAEIHCESPKNEGYNSLGYQNNEPPKDVSNKSNEVLNEESYKDRNNQQSKDSCSESHDNISNKSNEVLNEDPHEDINNQQSKDPCSESQDDISNASKDVCTESTENSNKEPTKDLNYESSQVVSNDTPKDSRTEVSKDVGREPIEIMNKKPSQDVPHDPPEDLPSELLGDVRSESIEDRNYESSQDIRNDPSKDSPSEPSEIVCTAPMENINKQCTIRRHSQ